MDKGDKAALLKDIPEDPRPYRSPKGGHPKGTVFEFVQVLEPKGEKAHGAQYIMHLDEFEIPQEPLDCFTIKDELYPTETQYWVVTPTRDRAEWWDPA
ncbi:MAG: hypothetical protein V3W28_06090 [Thermoplasmata archaeon]